MTTAIEPVGVSKVFPGSLLHFDLKIAIRWVAFKIDSIEASTVSSLRFKDPARDWGRGEGGGTIPQIVTNRFWNYKKLHCK